MPIVYTKKDQGNSVTTGTGAPTHSAVAGDRYTDTATGNTYQYTTSWQTVSYSAGGLTYFTEAQATASPNNLVNVDSLTAVASTTNADFAILPKGTGAITAAIPDGTATGGNKRGSNSLDLQTARVSAGRVASGQYSVTLGYNNLASNIGSVALGHSSDAAGDRSVALGGGAYAGGQFSTAISNNAFAGGYGSVAIGSNGLSNPNATGTAAVAIGGGTASGDYSFVSGFGTASGNQSVAMGGSYGGGATASGVNAVAIGNSTRATGRYSMAILNNSDTFSHANRLSYGAYNPSASNGTIGSIQGSTLVLGVDTTTATPTTLGTYQGTAIPLILQNNNVVRVKGTITGKQSASTNVGVWDIDCVIVRGTSAATTVIAGTPSISLVVNTGGFGNPTLTADTTNGGLDIKVTGVASTTIRWTCVFTTTETILA